MIEDSLIPALQLSTDDFAGRLANQTNLAIKGIIAIQAMSQISQALNMQGDAGHYSVCQTNADDRDIVTDDVPRRM